MNDNKMTAKKLADALAIILIALILLGLFGITGIFSQIGARLENRDGKTEIYTYTASEITELEVETGAADIVFAQGDSFVVECDSFGFSIKEKRGKLSIEEHDGIFSLNKNRKLFITLPDGFSFDKVDIESGASEISCDKLKTSFLELELGVGKLLFGNLEVSQKAEIDCGAGDFTVTNGTINNLNVSLGAGHADINSRLTSQSKIECGVGELELNLPDGKDNYTFDFETGLGKINFDNQKVENGDEIGNGANKVSVEGGVGNIDISFNNQ